MMKPFIPLTLTEIEPKADEDRDTVVDVVRRELGRDLVLLIYEYHTKEQISRTHDVHEALREAVCDVRLTESVADPQIVNTGTPVSKTAERRDLRIKGSLCGAHAPRAGSSTDITQDLIHQRNMRELNLLRGRRKPFVGEIQV